MKLKVGQKAPEIELPDQDGKIHKLSDYKGQWVLVYFYPKDDTPGCTKEACALRDNLPNFKKLKAVVLGISKDSAKSHRKFADKYKLPFTLLADENKEALKAYGAWGKKKFMGREYDGIFRNSYLINPQGQLVKIYEGVKPADHAAEVITDISQSQANMER
jgi:thioredoxin-dependent peroxiredoxin